MQYFKKYGTIDKVLIIFQHVMTLNEGQTTYPQNEELVKIQWEISSTQKQLKSLNNQITSLQDEEWKQLIQQQIKELKKTLKKLEDDKKTILDRTQSELTLERNIPQNIWTPEVLEYLTTQDATKREQAVDIIEHISNPNQLDNIKWESWVINILLQLLQIIFWWSFVQKHDGTIEQAQSEQQAITQTREKLQDPQREKGDFDFYTLLESKGWQHFKGYEESILKWTTRFNIDPAILLQLFIKEWSKGNLRAWPGGKNTALWLGQITNGTWNMICDSIWPKQYGLHLDKVKDRYDAESQIKAACIYLDYCARLRQVNHATAIVYYHTWPGNFSDQVAQRYLANNPAVQRYHGPWKVTHQSYVEAAERYYLS